MHEDMLIGDASQSVPISVHTGHKHLKYKLCCRSLYKVKECRKAFIYPKCILKHESTSGEENTYEYKQCEKAFQNQSYIQIHLKIVNGKKKNTCV